MPNVLGGIFMLVETIMRKNVVILTPSDTIRNARDLMKEHDIRHIPICVDEKLIGIVSDRDIRDSLPSSLFPDGEERVLQSSVSKIMTENTLTAHPLDFIEDAAKIIQKYRIGCLPIVCQQKVVGLVTAADVIQTFITITGADMPSSQIEVLVNKNNACIQEIVSIITSQKATILSMLTYPTEIEDKFTLAFRIKTMNPLSLVERLKEEGQDVLWPNI